MIFFTRSLYDGIQDGSGWSRRARRTFHRNVEIHRAYLRSISPLLPSSVLRLCRETLHDAVVEAVEQEPGKLTLVMDCRHALGGFRGRRVELAFGGVRRRISMTGLVGDWWLYEEAHLSSHAAFALHALFSSHEFEIEADTLRIKLLPQRRK
jgi:hypothetical protein